MTDAQIEEVFQDLWEEHGDDVSTEFLASLTADRCGIDTGRVYDALVAIHDTGGGDAPSDDT